MPTHKTTPPILGRRRSHVDAQSSSPRAHRLLWLAAFLLAASSSGVDAQRNNNNADCKSLSANRCGPSKAVRGKRYHQGTHLCAGKYRFGISRNKGELLLCENNKLIWRADYDGARAQNSRNVYFIHRNGGNLVVREVRNNGSYVSLFESKTLHETGTEMRVTNKGEVQITKNRKVLWSTKKPGGGPGSGPGPGDGGKVCDFPKQKCQQRLNLRKRLHADGAHVCSPNGKYRFGPSTAKGKGGMVLCENGKEKWSADMAHKKKDVRSPYLHLMSSGKLVLYDGSTSKSVWSTPTKNKNVRFLRVTNKGEVELVRGNGKAAWSLSGGMMGGGGVNHTNKPVWSSVSQPVDLKRAKKADGWFYEDDVCEIKSDGVCPCYWDDDDWYCTENTEAPWNLKTDNPGNDHLYGKCDRDRIPKKCPPGTMLCPMRKPRLDRWYDPKTKWDMYYFVDYDCIDCVPKEENCSKCSPGIWCGPLGRCVGPALVQWCKRTYGNRVE